MNRKNHPIPPPDEGFLQFVRELLYDQTNNLAHFPEDDWLGLGDAWDLNFGQDETGRYATLYPVLAGHTCTEVAYPVALLAPATRKLLLHALQRTHDLEVVPSIEEALTFAEGCILETFLTWVKADATARMFHEATFETRFQEWVASLGASHV